LEESSCDLRFRSDVPVALDEASSKGDRGIALRAWAVHPDRCPPQKDTPQRHRAVIEAMVKGRHGSPFEGGYLSVYVEAPVVVWWELTRHRFMSMGCPDLGFNLESGRYKVLEGEFYLPPPDRPCREPDGFKPMRPTLSLDLEAANDADGRLRDAYAACWREYRAMTANGVSREVARLCLGFGVYYSGYVSANPRTWLQFFSLRRRDERAVYATYPQWEIQRVDEQIEALFAERWPLTYEVFNTNGRVAP
jgi:thymidylate synthase (FAD)